jgi:hypothetical protein
VEGGPREEGGVRKRSIEQLKGRVGDAAFFMGEKNAHAMNVEL